MEFGSRSSFDHPRRRRHALPGGRAPAPREARPLEASPPPVRRADRPPERTRWFVVTGLALAVHALLLLLVIAPIWKALNAEDEPSEEPILVEFRVLSPDGEEDSDGNAEEVGEEAEPQEDQPRPVDDAVAEPVPVEDPTLPPVPDPSPVPPAPAPAASPGFTVADVTTDGGQDIPQPAVDLQPSVKRELVQADPGAEAPEAPDGVCLSDYSACVFESGDELRINPRLARQKFAGDTRIAAVSQAEFDRYRSAVQTPVAAPVAETGMPVYSNYGRFPSQYKVDLERLTDAAAGAPHSCRIYPDALRGFDEEPASLTILIDSSGSMIKNLYTSPATTCAWAAAKSALDAGIAVGVINFSDQIYALEASTDEQRIAEVIGKQQQRNTFLPEEQLEQLVADEGRRDLFLISDGRIANTTSALPHLESVLGRNEANQGFAVMLESDPATRKVRDDLHAIGFQVALFRF